MFTSPAYRCSPRYVQYVNVTNTRVVNVTQVTNVYNTVVVNRNVTVNRMNYTYANNAAAVTAVSRETFVSARPVATASVRVTSEQLQAARVTETAPLAPTRTSYVSSTAKPAHARPAVAFSQRQVVARLTPPSPPASHAAPRIVNAESSARVKRRRLPPRSAAPPARIEQRRGARRTRKPRRPRPAKIHPPRGPTFTPTKIFRALRSRASTENANNPRSAQQPTPNKSRPSSQKKSQPPAAPAGQIRAAPQSQRRKLRRPSPAKQQIRSSATRASPSPAAKV